MARSLAFALLFALCVPAPSQATPTRMLAVDSGNQVVPDDTDATHYYHLAPNFNDHWYYDLYASGKSQGWAFLDVGLGTVSLWWNKEYEPGVLYNDIAAAGNRMGLSSAGLTSGGNDWDPMERRVQAPETRVAGGWGIAASDALSLAVCVRWAESTQSRNNDKTLGDGSYDILGPSAAKYIYTDYPGLSVTAASNWQGSRGLAFAPSFGFAGESFTFDVKYDYILNRLDNRHAEKDFGPAGTASLEQTLKDKGATSWDVKPKLRYRMGKSGSLVLLGSYYALDLGTEHRVKGSFSGSGFSAKELTGFDHLDQEQAYGVSGWDGVLGWMGTYSNGKNLLVLGAKCQRQQVKTTTRDYTPRTGGATYDDTVLTRETQVEAESLHLPVFLGSELTLLPWLRGRASVSRSFYDSAKDSSVDRLYSAADGSLQGRSTRSSSSDASAGWTVVTGFGINAEAFAWDFALNSTLLGSTGAFANPVMQSSFSYSFQ